MSEQTAGVSADIIERAQLLHESGRPEDALRLLVPQVEQEPENPVLWLLIGVCRQAAGDGPGAMDALQEAVRLAPTWPVALESLSGLLVAVGRPHDALVPAREAVRLEPERWDSRRQLASALSNAGDTREGYRVASEATALAPEKPTAHLVPAVLALNRRDFGAAEEHYLRVLQLDPAHERARRDLSLVWTCRPGLWKRREKTGLALSGYADALASGRDDPLSRVNLEWLVWGLVARSRLLALLCLFVGLLGAMISGAGQGDPPASGALLPRLAALLVIGGVWALWLRRLGRTVPARLHTALVNHSRQRRTLWLMVVSVVLVVLAACALVLLPWSEPAILPLLLLPPVFLSVAVHFVGHISLARRRNQVMYAHLNWRHPWARAAGGASGTS